MKKEIQKILDKFVKECSEKLNLLGIIQFGSSTYSKNPHDIDLILVSNDYVRFTKEIMLIIKIIKKFEKEYPKIVFDFAGLADRKKKAEYSITVVFMEKGLLDTKYNPNDLFFFRTLSLDKDKKLLYGKDPFTKGKFKLTDWHLFEMLSIELTKSLRKCLDDEDYKFEAIYFLFKTYLRAMLILEGQFRKEQLLPQFKLKFGKDILLPKNSERILTHKVKKEDFENILRFCEDCLNYLVK